MVRCRPAIAMARHQKDPHYRKQEFCLAGGWRQGVYSGVNLVGLLVIDIHRWGIYAFLS